MPDFTKIFIESTIKIKEDKFDKFAVQESIKKTDNLYFKKWVLGLVKKEKDYFIKEALLDIIETYSSSKNSEIEVGINVVVNRKQYSIYASSGMFYVSANKQSDIELLIKTITKE